VEIARRAVGIPRHLPLLEHPVQAAVTTEQAKLLLKRRTFSLRTVERPDHPVVVLRMDQRTPEGRVRPVLFRADAQEFLNIRTDKQRRFGGIQRRNVGDRRDRLDEQAVIGLMFARSLRYRHLGDRDHRAGPLPIGIQARLRAQAQADR